jgi:hypothetical protein
MAHSPAQCIDKVMPQFINWIPVGHSFIGSAHYDPTLIRLAYAFAQATGYRQPPGFLETARFKKIRLTLYLCI